jgi:hypothetical protein
LSPISKNPRNIRKQEKNLCFPDAVVEVGSKYKHISYEYMKVPAEILGPQYVISFYGLTTLGKTTCMETLNGAK